MLVIRVVEWWSGGVVSIQWTLVNVSPLKKVFSRLMSTILISPIISDFQLILKILKTTILRP